MVKVRNEYFLLIIIFIGLFCNSQVLYGVDEFFFMVHGIPHQKVNCSIQQFLAAKGVHNNQMQLSFLNNYLKYLKFSTPFAQRLVRETVKAMAQIQLMWTKRKKVCHLNK